MRIFLIALLAAISYAQTGEYAIFGTTTTSLSVESFWSVTIDTCKQYRDNLHTCTHLYYHFSDKYYCDLYDYVPDVTFLEAENQFEPVVLKRTSVRPYLFVGRGYCKFPEWAHFSDEYPPYLVPGNPLYSSDRVQECMNRCLDAAAAGITYDGNSIAPYAFYVKNLDDEHRCACSTGRCLALSINHSHFSRYSINKERETYHFLGAGYCSDYVYLPGHVTYAPRLNSDSPLYDTDPIKECMERCLHANLLGERGKHEDETWAVSDHAFYVKDSDNFSCACSAGSCSSGSYNRDSHTYTTYRILSESVQYVQDGYCGGTRFNLNTQQGFNDNFSVADCGAYILNNTRCDGTGYFDAKEFVDHIECQCPTNGTCLTSPQGTDEGWKIYKAGLLAAPSAYPTMFPTSSPSHCPSMSPTFHPTNEPSKTPSFSPSAQPTLAPTSRPSVSPTGFPTFDPTKGPSTLPSLSPTKYPTVDFLGGACADMNGDVLQGWSVSMNLFSDCVDECAKYQICITTSFGISFHLFNSTDSFCIMHQSHQINLHQPPKLFHGKAWKEFKGSNHFDSVDGTYTTIEDQESMKCQTWSHESKEQEIKERGIRCLIWIGCIVSVYYVAIMIIWGMKCFPNHLHHSESIRALDVNSLDVKKTRVRGSTTDESVEKKQDLCIGKCTWDILLGNLGDSKNWNVREKNFSLIWVWFKDLGCLKQSRLLIQLADLGADVAFVFSYFWDEYLGLLAFALISQMVSLCCTLMMLYNDIGLYRKDGREKGAKRRRMYSLRWRMFFILPIEDISMICLATFILIHGIVEIWGILKIAATILSVIFIQVLAPVLEARNFNEKSRKKSVTTSAATNTVELAQTTQPDPLTQEANEGGDSLVQIDEPEKPMN